MTRDSVLIDQIVPYNKAKFYHRIGNHPNKVFKGKKNTFPKSELGSKRDYYITQNKNIEI